MHYRYAAIALLFCFSCENEKPETTIKQTEISVESESISFKEYYERDPRDEEWALRQEFKLQNLTKKIEPGIPVSDITCHQKSCLIQVETKPSDSDRVMNLMPPHLIDYPKVRVGVTILSSNENKTTLGFYILYPTP